MVLILYFIGMVVSLYYFKKMGIFEKDDGIELTIIDFFFIVLLYPIFWLIICLISDNKND